MSVKALRVRLHAPPNPGFDAAGVLAAMPDPVLVVNATDRVVYANPATEQFFGLGAAHLLAMGLLDLIPFDSPLLALVRKVRDSGAAVHEHAAEFATHRTGVHLLNIQITPIADHPGHLVVNLQYQTIASRMDHQLTHRSAARSVTGMAAILAHEVKNPLSGIRGAAQLLEQGAKPEDVELTRLICEETDRICALVDRMEMFSDPRPIERESVNIHQVLEHVRRIAEAGFASDIGFKEIYDPSLPPVAGNRDQLVQVLLNLVKNAAEAIGDGNGEILLATAYRHGLRIAVPGGGDRLHLPLEVSVQDSGPGIPPEVREHMFDPFVSTKTTGTGLGLSLVAKIVGDHGGVIEFDSEPGRTIFRVRLPVQPGNG